ncbi:uncharacterized protein LOC117580990 [Drosophila guanche]|uniref:Uncharacterized protein n=1 Tax=Drosophila guanche TaxID=7266 RepID=A0A3B0JBY5_DROGU|nr:uncharacterized protein LOC117580990 [Drosophila guanche]SPP78023.1 Hypothetical predicted protein [Drosophila guanche]
MTVPDDNDPRYAPLYEILTGLPARVEVNAESVGLGYLNILPYFGEMIQICLVSKGGNWGKLVGKLEMLTPNGDVILTQCSKLLCSYTSSERKLPLGIVKVPGAHIKAVYWKSSNKPQSSAGSQQLQ